MGYRVAANMDAYNVRFSISFDLLLQLRGGRVTYIDFKEVDYLQVPLGSRTRVVKFEEE